MTFHRIGFLALAVVVGWTSASPAQQLLDIVPRDVTAAIAVRNLNELIRKGDKLVEETQLQMPIRPSQLFDFGAQALGIRGGFDRERPVAILLVLPENEAMPPFEFFVAILPFTDLDQMAANFGFPEGRLKPDKLVKLDPANQPFGKFVFVRDKHLFVGDNEKAMQRVIKSKSVGAELSKDRREALNRADLLVHINPRATSGEWPKALKAVQEEIGKTTADAEERKNLQEFISGLESVRSFFVALRVGGGLGFSFLADFPKDQARGGNAFLAALASGTGGSDLRGLPEGNLLVAQGIRGDGAKGALVARALLDFFLKHVFETQQVLSAADRPMFAGVFQEVWQRLQGSRWGLYQSSDESRFGLFTLVAVLDTQDAGQFLAEMKTLARLAQGTLDLKPDNKDDSALIRKLVVELGDPTYRVRQSATTKLRLIGEPALPHLEKLIGNSDLEVSRRAQRIRDGIAAVAAERRKELLAKGLPKLVRPSLTFFPKAEERSGNKVDIVRVKLSDSDSPLTKQLQQLLGPDWDKIRLAAHGKQVVVLLGSDTELLDQAVKNLKDEAPGLAAAKPLAGFHRLAHPERKIEFHIALHNTLALITSPENLPRPLPKAGESLTSFSLAVEGHQLQLDLWLPSAEIRLLARNKNFFGW
jgi:hypothetical protein